MTKTKYHAHLEGFIGDFDTYAALEAWAVEMKNRYGFAGKSLQVYERVNGAYSAGRMVTITI